MEPTSCAICLYFHGFGLGRFTVKLVMRDNQHNSSTLRFCYNGHNLDAHRYSCFQVTHNLRPSLSHNTSSTTQQRAQQASPNALIGLLLFIQPSTLNTQVTLIRNTKTSVEHSKELTFMRQKSFYYGGCVCELISRCVQQKGFDILPYTNVFHKSQ